MARLKKEISEDRFPIILVILGVCSVVVLIITLAIVDINQQQTDIELARAGLSQCMDKDYHRPIWKRSCE